MTKLMDQAINAVRALPEAAQDELARFLIDIAGDVQPQLTADETRALAEAEAEIARGERASPHDIEKFWRTHK